MVVPTVSGTAQVGHALAATNGSWSNGPTGYSYRWRNCDSAGGSCANIAGATASNYTVGSGDAGHTIDVVVTASNGSGSASAASAPTGVVAGLPPANSSAPAISGSPVQGSPLSASTGTWSGSPSSYGYQWEHCGSSCSPISGATGGSYMLASGDVGQTVEVVVSASNAWGSARATSIPTSTVQGPAPANMAAPVISGSAVQGQALSASTGSWSGSPTAYGYQWEDCGSSCAPIGGATGSSYTLASGDVSKAVTVVVTASNGSGSATGTATPTGTVAGLPPANSSAPAISGSPVQGSPLSASTGTWSNSPSSYGYQWEDCGSSCSPISGATGSSYTPVSGDVGQTVEVVVSASNAWGSASATSIPTSTVQSPPPANTAVPTISGTAAVGSRLTATQGNWSNSPASYGYQWQDCNSSGASCTSISGATSSSYTLQSSDAGDTVRAAVTATNSSGSTTANSAVTSLVPGGGIAGDVYVSASAPSGGSGSVSSPFQSITQCASVVTAGHTCWIETGTYSDTNINPANSGTSGNMVTFAASPGASPVLEGGGRAVPAFNIAGKNYVRISGLTIQHYDPTTSGDGPNVGGEVQLYNSVGSEVDHNTVQDMAYGGGQIAGIMVFDGSTGVMPYTILDNKVTSIGWPRPSGIGTPELDGIYVGQGNGPYNGGLIQGNVVSQAGKDDIRQECGNGTSTVTIQDNIVFAGSVDGIDVNSCYVTGQVLVKNNFVYANLNSQLIAKHSDNVTFENNTVVGKTTGLFNGVGGNCPFDGSKDCEDGVSFYTGPIADAGDYGTVNGAVWHVKLLNNIFYGGDTTLDMTQGDYTVAQGAGSPGNRATIDYNDYYGQQYATAYADQHECNGSSVLPGAYAVCPGTGSWFFAASLSAEQSNTGWDAHTLANNPNFNNPSGGDFTLGSSSPLTGKSSTGGNMGADPSQLTGIGPAGNYSLANTGL